MALWCGGRSQRASRPTLRGRNGGSRLSDYSADDRKLLDTLASQAVPAVRVFTRPLQRISHLMQRPPYRFRRRGLTTERRNEAAQSLKSARLRKAAI